MCYCKQNSQYENVSATPTSRVWLMLGSFSIQLLLIVGYISPEISLISKKIPLKMDKVVLGRFWGKITFHDFQLIFKYNKFNR